MDRRHFLKLAAAAAVAPYLPKPRATDPELVEIITMTHRGWGPALMATTVTMRDPSGRIVGTFEVVEQHPDGGQILRRIGYVAG